MHYWPVTVLALQKQLLFHEVLTTHRTSYQAGTRAAVIVVILPLTVEPRGASTTLHTEHTPEGSKTVFWLENILFGLMAHINEQRQWHTICTSSLPWAQSVRVGPSNKCDSWHHSRHKAANGQDLKPSHTPRTQCTQDNASLFSTSSWWSRDWWHPNKGIMSVCA